MNAFIVERGLGARESTSVVTQIDPECVEGVPGLAQRIEQQADTTVQPADRFVVIRQVAAHFGQIRQVLGHDDFGRIVSLALDARPRARVTEVLLGTMRIAEAHHQ
jgi:hypothetical protein